MDMTKIRMFWIALSGALLLTGAAAVAYKLAIMHIGAARCIPLMMPV